MNKQSINNVTRKDSSQHQEELGGNRDGGNYDPFVMTRHTSKCADNKTFIYGTNPGLNKKKTNNKQQQSSKLAHSLANPGWLVQ